MSNKSFFKFQMVVMLALVINTACTSNLALSPGHHTYVSFGSIGGFSGAYTEYKLLPDGSVFKKMKYKGPYLQQEHFSKQQTSQFFSILEATKSSGYSINNPGNLTYFMNMTKKNTTSYELIWGGPDQQIDQMISTLYNNMKMLCRPHKVIK